MKKPQKKWTPVEEMEAIALYEAGMRSKAIAEQLGRTVKSIDQKMNRLRREGHTETRSMVRKRAMRLVEAEVCPKSFISKLGQKVRAWLS